MNRREAAPWIAGNKFGLGLRPGEHARIAGDPRGWLREQLSDIATVPAVLRSLGDDAALLVEFRRLSTRFQALQQRLDEPGAREAQQQINQISATVNGRYEQQQQARLKAAINTEMPFSERLVLFWSNHFTVEAARGLGLKGGLRYTAVPYEISAIRGNLDRNFADLLLAVEQHPAMLIYLDNNSSIGPNSPEGKKSRRGINENLAREILELHTLGVDGGYTQADVTAFANILTGWRADPLQQAEPAQAGARRPGGFRFEPAMHEPGAHEVLGRTYDGNEGVRQGEAALRDMARHQSTARHIARKLATHFVADTPPESAVKKLEQTFIETGGWLPAVHEALIDLDEAWDPALRKFKTPEDLVVSAARALALPQRAEKPELAIRTLNQALKTFGQEPFSAGSPAGWPDAAVFWGAPDSLLKRIEWFGALARLIPAGLDSLALQPEILPPNDALKRELEGAESAAQAMVLLLASPSFQWRSV